MGSLLSRFSLGIAKKKPIQHRYHYYCYCLPADVCAVFDKTLPDSSFIDQIFIDQFYIYCAESHDAVSPAYGSATDVAAAYRYTYSRPLDFIESQTLKKTSENLQQDPPICLCDFISVNAR